MNAEEEVRYYRNEFETYISRCRAFGINPSPANRTTRYDKDGSETKEEENNK